ncbi:MAG: UDP-GlcNAc:undecaprenyl-phosphate/decaprenyl-phosphate GlcNAc-phosphate transferase, partial [Actinomycetota bacterium]|nr:UDP-GlcNAc:undecaprenyl-phosphate/decaprenyl-phosphate GlcNAc-phosphate transferase [Actinomycetota bacterium]
LAASTVSLTGQINPAEAADAYQQYATFLPLLLPFAVLFVPFADLVLAVVRRTKAGRAPWAPDKQHLHHRLLELGHSQRRAVLIMYLWSSLLGAGVVALSITQGPMIVLSIGGTIAVLTLLLVNMPRMRAAYRARRHPA